MLVSIAYLDRAVTAGHTFGVEQTVTYGLPTDYPTYRARSNSWESNFQMFASSGVRHDFHSETNTPVMIKTVEVHFDGTPLVCERIWYQHGKKYYPVSFRYIRKSHIEIWTNIHQFNAVHSLISGRQVVGSNPIQSLVRTVVGNPDTLVDPSMLAAASIMDATPAYSSFSPMFADQDITDTLDKFAWACYYDHRRNQSRLPAVMNHFVPSWIDGITGRGLVTSFNSTELDARMISNSSIDTTPVQPLDVGDYSYTLRSLRHSTLRQDLLRKLLWMVGTDLVFKYTLCNGMVLQRDIEFYRTRYAHHVGCSPEQHKQNDIVIADTLANMITRSLFTTSGMEEVIYGQYYMSITKTFNEEALVVVTNENDETIWEIYIDLAEAMLCSLGVIQA